MNFLPLRVDYRVYELQQSITCTQLVLPAYHTNNNFIASIVYLCALFHLNHIIRAPLSTAVCMCVWLAGGGGRGGGGDRGCV